MHVVNINSCTLIAVCITWNRHESLLDMALGPLPLDATLIKTEIPCQLPYDLDPLNVMMTS